jgi:hypothetical protein
MNVVCHQDIGMERQTVPRRRVLEAAQETQTIAVTVENVLAIVAPQSNVHGQGGREQSGKSGHRSITEHPRDGRQDFVQ